MKTLEIWSEIKDEANTFIKNDEDASIFLDTYLEPFETLGSALSYKLSKDLACDENQEGFSQNYLFQELDKTFGDEDIIAGVIKDLSAVKKRDPAASGYLMTLLFSKGFLALQAHRAANKFIGSKKTFMALYLQSQSSKNYGVDIHPSASIGNGVMLDHATGIVIGETSVVEDDVSIFQGVTLGGTGKITGDRHPKVRKGVLISAGAKIIGNVEIGEGAKVAAGSVVLEDVEMNTTVAGVPAIAVGKPATDSPAKTVDHSIKD
jgi:serine O-acetyltransferase|tara:strand:+ start:4766 stop:5554 length:789 start_codon:yes stop_codon:yes gene_type:complete